VSWLDQFKNRKVLYGGGSIASVLLVAGILIVVALLADWHQVRFDTTKGKTQSLSTVTKGLLKEVKKPLTMTVFIGEAGEARQSARDLLQRYAYANSKVTFNFVDPEREPLKAREAGYRFPGNVLLEYEGHKQMADRPDEESISNALRKLLKGERKQVYFLTGHGERDLEDSKPGGFQVAKKALENEGYEVATLNLLTQAQVPDKAAAVIVAGPKKPLLANEIQALKTYLDRDGRLLIMLEAFQDAGLKDFLAGYGVGLDDGVILDVNQLSRALGVSAIMPLVAQYGPSRITRDFKNIVTVFPMARPLILNRNVKDVSLLPLATTMASSYEKLGQDWIKTGQGAFNPQVDKKGPFTIGAQADIKLAQPEKKEPQPQEPGKKEEAKKTYMVVYGDVEFAGNAYFNLFGNGDLFLNTTNFLAQEMGQIAVRRAQKAQFLTLSAAQTWVLFVVTLVWAPLLMIVAGIWVYRRRRTIRRR
jgi:ABC-type uncharacterized transport system involved in gliding motility auxiliary subunit